MHLSMLRSERLRFSKKFLESPIPWIRDRLRKRYRLLVLAERIRCERLTLSTLPDAELQDIGLHRAEVDAEVRRRFWDLPEGRVNERDK